VPYVRSFSVIVPTNTSDRPSNACLRLAGPSSLVPSTSCPEASIFVPPSVARHFPVRSKFSSENPIGSIILWHAAQTAFFRCSSIRSRTDVIFWLPSFSLSGGTLGGGRGGGVPKRFSRTHFPRETGEVRFATDVTSRKLAWPSKPRRESSSRWTFRKRLPW